MTDTAALDVGEQSYTRVRVDTTTGRVPVTAVPDDGPHIDAFSRLRVSEPEALFSVQCQYSTAPLVMEIGNTGSGTAPAHSSATRMVTLAATAGAGTSFIQSYEYIPYQPGKSQLIFVTGLLGAASAGATKDVGLFDADNGIFLRQNGLGGLQIVRRSKTTGAVVDVAVNQRDWNLNALPSLDPTKVFILVIDAQFLGMGRVRVGFDIDGQIIPVHEFTHANKLTTPYMQTLSLPVQMLLTTTTEAASCAFKCASVSSEGGFENPASYFFATPECSAQALSDTRTHLTSIRPKTTLNSITNRSRFQVESVDLIVTGSNPIRWELCIGSVFSASSTWADVNATYSAFEYASSAGALSATTTVMAAGYVAASVQAKTATSQRLSTKYPITLDRAGAVRASGTLTLAVTGLGGSSNCRGIINFSEVR